MERETNISTFRVSGVNKIIYPNHSAQCHLRISKIINLLLLLLSCSSKTKFVIYSFFLDM